MDSCFALYWGSSAWHNRRTSERKVAELELACGASVSPFVFGAKRDRGRGVSVLIAREIKREPKDKRRGRERGRKEIAFPSFLPQPLPALLLAPLFARSLSLVPRSLFLNRTEMLATQAKLERVRQCLNWYCNTQADAKRLTFS